MCKYVTICKRCGLNIEVNAEYENMQDVILKLASDCPNLDFVSQTPLTLDAMHELMVSKEKSEFMKLLDDNSHPKDCSVYDSVIDAIGQGLGRYYEIA
jgi:hypothetical protein